MQTPGRPNPQWTILESLRWTTDYFVSHGIDTPRLDAEILLATALGLSRLDLYLRYDQPLSAEERSRFKGLIKRRIRREPVAYILEQKEFWTVSLRVTPDVLIPRPETECLVEASLALIPTNPLMKIFEIGTGSGAVSIALASERTGHQIIASDLSEIALCIARENARLNGLDGVVQFFCGNGCLPLKETDGPFDLIVSNPPYIQSDEINRLEPEIRQYEPKMALDGGPDGLECIRQILTTAHRHLKSGGHLLLEIGWDQPGGVQTIVDAVGAYDHIAFLKDLGGRNRVVRLRKENRY